MKSRTRLLVLLLFVLLTPAERAAAQSPPAKDVSLFEMVLRDGSRAFGTIERETEEEVVFRTHAGALVTAKRAEIALLRRVAGRIEEGEFYRADTQRTRLFFAPTARSLGRGQVSLGVYQILAPFVQVGVTDRLSVGGGTPLVFGLDESTRPFWLTPKFQVYNGGTGQIAVGALHMLNVSGESLGIAYGVGTFGSTDNALSVGVGLAYADAARGGVVMVGGERRVRPNLKLITENYVWRNGGIVSGGVRFLGERLSADLGLAAPFGDDRVFFAFPVVNFVYVF